MKATFEIDLLNFKKLKQFGQWFDATLIVSWTFFQISYFSLILYQLHQIWMEIWQRSPFIGPGHPMQWWIIPLIYFRIVGLLLLYIWWGQNGWRGWKTTGRIVHQKALHLNWTRTPLDPQSHNNKKSVLVCLSSPPKMNQAGPIFLIRLSELLKDVYYERRASHSQAAKAKQERKVLSLLSGPFSLLVLSFHVLACLNRGLEKACLHLG